MQGAQGINRVLFCISIFIYNNGIDGAVHQLIYSVKWIENNPKQLKMSPIKYELSNTLTSLSMMSQLLMHVSNLSSNLAQAYCLLH